MTSVSSARRRALFALLAALVVPVGLATRRHPQLFPEFVATYAGDVLWAVVAYLLVGVLAPAASIRTRATIALASAFMIEFSQLWHPEWLDAIRGTTLGHLALGIGFEWSDLPCYTIGVLAAALLERASIRSDRSKSSAAGDAGGRPAA